MIKSARFRGPPVAEDLATEKMAHWNWGFDDWLIILRLIFQTEKLPEIGGHICI